MSLTSEAVSIGTIAGPQTLAVPIALPVAVLFMDAGDILVKKYDSLTDTTVTLTGGGVDYTMTVGAGDGPVVGTLTPVAAILVTDTWYWYRDTARSQNYAVVSPLSAQSLEDALDRWMLIAQEDSAEVGRLDVGATNAAITLSAGWTENDGLRYYLQNGFVHLEGNIAKSSNTVSPETMFTLPAGFRPQREVKFLCPIELVNNSHFHAIIAIDTDGTVDITMNSPRLPDSLYLDGIRFRPA